MRYATFLLLALFTPPATAQSDSERLHKLFADYHENQLKNNPEAATSLGRNEYNHLWTDWSPAALEARQAQAGKYLRELDAFANAKLDGQDRLSRDLLHYQIRQALDLQPLRVFLLPVSQMGGFHSSVFQTIDQMPTRTVKDYENIIARISALPVFIDQHIANFQEAIRMGLTQPRIVVDLTRKQVAAQMEPSPGSRLCSPHSAAFQPISAGATRTGCDPKPKRRISKAFGPRGGSCSLFIAKPMLPRPARAPL